MDAPAPEPPKSSLTLGMKLILWLGPPALILLTVASHYATDWASKKFEQTIHRRLRSLERRTAPPSPLELQEAKSEEARAGKVLVDAPDDLNARMDRGRARHTLGNYQGAVEDFTFVVQGTPDYVHGWYHRACAYDYIGETNLARRDHLKVLEHSPADADERYIRALALEQLGRPKEALQEYRRCLAAAPKDWGFRDQVQLNLQRLEAAN